MSKNTVAISADFLSAFAALPRQKQGRVMTFMNKFRNNPQSPGIHYEKLKDTSDPNMYSVRIDDTYRGIVVNQKTSGVYLLLWVDHHDKAYQWASRKRCTINPTTGTVQVFDVKEKKVEKEVTEGPPLFAEVSDDQLLQLGVPAEKIDETRRINSLDEFYSLKSSFPEDAYEGLEWIANGFDVEEILDTFYREIDDASEKIPTDDFKEALFKPGSMKSFTVVEGEEELQMIMGAPLEKWRVFLHPKQREIATKNYNGPARVTGGAGTGKTVVAMHRAKWLASKISDKKKILFTTFTANLADDIKENLRKICTVHELKRIDVINLDAWVVRFLRDVGFDYRIIYGNELDRLWSTAIALTGETPEYLEQFYQSEWAKVIQAQDVLTLKDYVKASRKGRGVPLNRKKRMAIWKVFEEYKNLMNERQVRDVYSAMYDCRQVISNRYREPLYSSIIVDEGQDFSMNAYRLLRSMAGEEHENDIFIVGDAHQRIYRNRAVLSQCGVNVRGRSSFLRINYRTTEEIRKWSFGLLKGISFDDLDEGTDDGACQSLIHGKEPIVKDFSSADKEFSFILGEIRKMEEEGVSLKDICVVARTSRILDDYIARLSKEGIRSFEIRRSKIDDRTLEGIRIATMHRVKGLEFECIFVVSVNKNIVPLPAAIAYEDKVSYSEGLISEKCLLYVALTRAKVSAYITSYGGYSDFLKIYE